MSRDPGTLLALGTVAAMAGLAAVGRRGGSRSARGVEAWYHLSENPKFRLDQDYIPVDNSISIVDRGGRRGIYVARDVEPWLNRYGYWRPFVVEIEASASVVSGCKAGGRWGGEMFVPASSFGGLTVRRVIPLDAYAREQFGEHGWVEAHLERTFDAGEPIRARGFGEPFVRPFARDYRYSGPDVREMSPGEVARLERDLQAFKRFRQGPGGEP